MAKQSPTHPYSPTMQCAARIYLGFIVSVFLVLASLIVFGQTAPPDPGLGGTLATNQTLGGTTIQSAATVGKTLIMVVNYTGNVVMPIIAAIFVALAAVCYFTGRNFARCLIVAGMCVTVTAVTRLIETLVSTAGR